MKPHFMMLLFMASLLLSGTTAAHGCLPYMAASLPTVALARASPTNSMYTQLGNASREHMQLSALMLSMAPSYLLTLASLRSTTA